MDSQKLSVTKRALLELRELRSRLKQYEQKESEPVAVTGLACRFPGAPDSAAFWDVLSGGVDCVGDIPGDRWDWAAYYDADTTAAGKIYSGRGACLDHIDTFDPAFFGISALEAEHLDPQQRLILEVTWEALEAAAQPPLELAEKPVGVFVGNMTSDYQIRKLQEVPETDLDAFFLTSGGNCASGRISYTLKLQGPSINIDTACSSALVATHLACQSLRARECDMALASAVHLALLPEAGVAMCRAGILSEKGSCSTFDGAADGFARGEGCGVLVLKRLSDALRDGDPIIAQIDGTAVNHDGPSAAISAPNGLAQIDVIGRALRAARVSPADLSFVEAHGSGTPLGDPIEVQALGEVIRGRAAADHLPIESVKTNVGHLEPVAGMAGIIKVLLALQREEIPPHIHLRALNPYISLEDSAVVIPSARCRWPAGDVPRHAGVSSFGLTGTNAHAVLSDPPPVPEAEVAPSSSRSVQLLSLSGRSEGALGAAVARYVEFLSGEISTDFADICHTSLLGRSHFEHRLAVAASSAPEAMEMLTEVQGGDVPAGVATGVCDASAPPLVAFLFTGQGSQRTGMGQTLYGAQPEFTRALDSCAEILSGMMDISLLDLMFAAEHEDALNSTRYTQPALFAIEYALSELWRSWGVRPDVVMGHSIGEFAAACVAGVFSLEDGLRLVVERGRLMQEGTPPGRMVAIQAPGADVQSAIESCQGRLSLAAVNGPESVVVSGEEDAVASIAAEFEARGVKATVLNVSTAFHSPLMEPILDRFEEIAAGVTFSPPAIKMISTVTGEEVSDDVCSARYWRQNVARPVQFYPAVKYLADLGCQVFLEVGPGAQLTGMGQLCLPEHQGRWTPSLRKDHDDWTQMLTALGGVYVSGVDVDWRGFEKNLGHSRIGDLPTYPFQRERYWIKALEEARGSVDPLEDCFFVPRWTPAPAAAAEGHAGAEIVTWLVFADDAGVGVAAAEGLARLGSPPVLVTRGQRFESLGDGRWQLDPSSPEDYDRLLSALKIDGHQRRSVLHLWSLDLPGPAALDEDIDPQAAALGCQSLLYIVQALDRLPGDDPAAIWTITRGGQAVAASEGAAAFQAPLWGMGKVLSLEHPQLRNRLVDLDPAAAVSACASALVSEMSRGSDEEQIAFRGGERLVKRLVTCRDIPRAGATKIRPDGTYLLTGGFGDIGLEMAQYLVERGARHLVMVGRRGATGAAAEAVDRFRAAGVEVMIGKADVSDRAALAGVLSEARGTMPALRGVLHMAGAYATGLLSELTWEDCHAALAPKVLGSWNLRCLTSEASLDFFVLFSSMTSLFGFPRQGNYAAGNAFMDALAYQMRASGRTAHSINYGPWSQTLDAYDDQETGPAAVFGVSGMSTERCLEALSRIVSAALPQVGVVRADWAKMKDVFSGQGRLLEDLAVHTHTTEPGAAAQATPSGIIGEVLDMSDEDREVLIRSHLQQKLAKSLKSGAAPDLDRSLADQGLDSLGFIDFRTWVKAQFGVDVQIATLMAMQNLNELAGYVVENLGDVAIPDPRGASDEPPPPAAEDAGFAAISRRIISKLGADLLMEKLDDFDEEEMDLLMDLFSEED